MKKALRALVAVAALETEYKTRAIFRYFNIIYLYHVHDYKHHQTPLLYPSGHIHPGYLQVSTPT